VSGYGRGARMCAHPIRLAGTEHRLDRGTGELVPDAGDAAGVLLTACGNRRSARCPACSALYRADTWQLIAAGLRGGKGLPDTITEHPRLFLTLTAPAFGAVHSRGPVGRRPGLVGPGPGTARTSTPAAARCGIRPATGSWAPRCASSASTTPGRRCGTPTSGSCGGAPASAGSVPSPTRPA